MEVRKRRALLCIFTSISTVLLFNLAPLASMPRLKALPSECRKSNLRTFSYLDKHLCSGLGTYMREHAAFSNFWQTKEAPLPPPSLSSSSDNLSTDHNPRQNVSVPSSKIGTMGKIHTGTRQTPLRDPEVVRPSKAPSRVLHTNVSKRSQLRQTSDEPSVKPLNNYPAVTFTAAEKNASALLPNFLPAGDSVVEWATLNITSKNISMVVKGEDEAARLSELRQVHGSTNESACWLQWTAQTDATIVAAIEKLQHPQSCDQLSWIAVEMDVSGLGVQLNRTVVPVPRQRGKTWEYAAFDGCDVQHLGCFFPNITSCSLEQNPHMQKALDDSKAKTWEFFCPEPCLHQQELSRSEQPLLHLGPMRGNYPGWYPQVWHPQIWKPLEDAGGMQNVCDGVPESVDMKQLPPQAPIFMLHAVITRWLFQPTKQILTIADDILSEHQEWRAPAVAMHVRQTDKKDEDVFWRTHNHRYRNLSDYTDAAAAVADQTNRSWNTILLLSDSQTVIHSMRNFYAKDKEVKVMHDNKVDRTVMEKRGGHANVPAELKLNIQAHFLAMLKVVSLTSDYAIGTLSSNVFKVMVQLLGGMKRVVQTEQVGPIAFSLDSTDGWSG